MASMTRLRSRALVRTLGLSCLVLLPGVVTTTSSQQPITDGDRVILITLDGARHQEIFSGMNREILQSTLKENEKVEAQATYTRFWAEAPEERRKRLMPFFWGTL